MSTIHVRVSSLCELEIYKVCTVDVAVVAEFVFGLTFFFYYFFIFGSKLFNWPLCLGLV